MRLVNAIIVIKDRIFSCNNRDLGIIGGCIIGFTLAIMLLLNHSDAYFPIVGLPAVLLYKIIGVLLATGTGGNLFSYIGASIDIITEQKTVFDLGKYIKTKLKR